MVDGGSDGARDRLDRLGDRGLAEWIGAVSTALDSLAPIILDEHVKHCIAGALAALLPA